jgi:hypothetical protein
MNGDKPLFKVGQIVTIDIDSNKRYPFGITDMMIRENGRKFEIIWVHKCLNIYSYSNFDFDFYMYKLKGLRFTWATPMFAETKEL